MQVYNVDDPREEAILKQQTPVNQVLPRETVYGDAPGLIPFGEALPDKLIDPKDYKETIQFCHDRQIFPIYHQHATWAPPGVMEWYQDGLKYCWTWGGTAALQDCEAREKKWTTLLSPVAMGYLVDWRNAGNYLDSVIQGFKERGVPEASYTPDMLSRNPKTFKEGWEDNALLHRLGDVYDTDAQKMIQHAISILACGIPGHNAFNWWGHSTETVCVWWDETQVNNLRWGVRNSHNENDVIVMTGNKAVPDEFYGYASTKT
jgi:hypothetical protein